MIRRLLTAGEAGEADGGGGSGAAVLVTLVGPAGAGKTRLAEAIARLELERRDGRVAWVALGAVEDPTRVPSVVAAALGIPDAPGRTPLAALAEVVGEKRPAPGRPTLLVLDAVLRLVPDVGLLEELRTSLRSVVILATSRRPLRATGERTVEVGPLPLPAPGATPADVAASPAVRLLVAHASRSEASVGVTDANAAALGDVARRLDGLPLALELAGAALRRVGPRQLLERLAAPADPGSGPAGPVAASVLDPLAAALDRSLDLVSPAARVLYRRLAVLVGPIEPDLARGIVERGVLLGLVSPPGEIDAAIAELVDASLLKRPDRSDGGDAPPSMLETVRAHGRSRLEAEGETATAEWAHAHEVLERAEALDERLVPLVDPSALAGLDRLAPEAEVAFDRAAARGGDDVVLRIAAALGEWWRVRGRLADGRLRIELALRRTVGSRSGVRAAAMYADASLAYRQGDFGRAHELLREAIVIRAELGDRRHEARAHNLLALVLFDAGRMSDAIEEAELGLAIRRELGDDLETAASLNTVGGIRHFGGELRPAADALEEGLAIRERLGDESGVAVCLANLALVDRDLGEIERGAERLERAVATRRRLGDRLRQAATIHNLGLIRLEQGRLADARAAIEEALALSREHGDRVETADALADLALIARDEGRIADAWRQATESVRLATRIRALGVVALALDVTAALAGGEDPLDGARLWGAAAALRAR
ncbi:MAG TPA: tetratricopeptide repeat protein, partial [Candidatus Limnocylindrales bacterium]|nr:tetratricopeptide repeat protein [Candidatus Limnocylindrales bacterium]